MLNYGEEVIIDGVKLFKLDLDKKIIYLEVTLTKIENNKLINKVTVRDVSDGKVNTDDNFIS
jgi:hypothetical protein